MPAAGTRLFQRVCLALIGVAVWLAPWVAVRAAPSADAGLQAKILLRALAYDRNLLARAGVSVTIGIVYRQDNPESVASKQDMREAFNALSKLTLLGLPLRFTTVEYVSADHLKTEVASQGIDILFLTPGIASHLGPILALSHQAKIATITGETAYVQDGVAIGVALRDGAPKLVVNLPGSKEEGMSLSSELMRIAEVVGR